MKLKPGEIKCDQCNGTGVTLYRISNSHHNGTCSKCYGSGKLDWIEVVVGKKISNPIMSGVTWLPPSYEHPKNAKTGQAYIDTTNNKTYIFDGNV